jgi:hypothetical protein
VAARTTYSTLNDRLNGIATNYSSVISNSEIIGESLTNTAAINTSNTTAYYNSQIGTIQNDHDSWQTISETVYGNSRSMSDKIIYGNKMYINSYSYGIKVLNLDTETWEGDWHEGSTPALPEDDYLNNLAYDPVRNDIYTASYNTASGLIKIDVDANTVTHYTTSNSNLLNNAMGESHTSSFYYYNGKLYLFPQNNYMQVFDVVNETFTNYGSASGLPSDNVYSVEGNGNELHISSSSGFYIWNMDTDTLVKRFYSGSTNGLYPYTSTVRSTNQDPNDPDIVWVATERSWQKVSKTNGWQEFHRTDQDTGLPNNRWNIKRIGDQLWLGSYYGHAPSGYLVYDLNAESYFVISDDGKVIGNVEQTNSYHPKPFYYNGYYYFGNYSDGSLYKTQLNYENNNIFETNVLVNTTNPITTAKFDYNGGAGPGNNIDWYLSANGGTNWEGPVTPNTLWEFTNTGTELKARAEMTAGTGTTPVITGLEIAAYDGLTWAGQGSTTVETEVLQARDSSTFGTFGSLDLRLEDIDTRVGTLPAHNHNSSYLQLTGGTLSGALNVNANLSSNHLLPNAHNSFDLGSSSNIWNDVYANNISAGTASFSGNVSVASPVNNDHATTKSYVDSAIDSGVASGVSGTTNRIAKFTSSSTVGDSAIYESSGDIGIGTIYPGVNFNIEGSTTDIDSVTTSGSNLNTDWNNDALLKIQQGASGGNALAMSVSGTSNERKGYIQVGHTSGSYSNLLGSLALNPFGGKVSIGKISPSADLDVNGTGNFTGTVVVATPTSSSHATTKSYVDSSIGSISDNYIGNAGNHTAGGDLNMNNNSINNIQNIITDGNRTLPRIILNSTGTGDNWTDQGAYISIGENSTASMHMTYRGDGYGWIGSGAISNAIPGASYFQFDYDNNLIDTNSRLDMSNQRITTLGTPINNSDAATKAYTDSLVSGNTYWSVNGNDIYNTNSGSLGVGINSPRGDFDINGYKSINRVESSHSWTGSAASNPYFIPLGAFRPESNIQLSLDLGGCGLGGSGLNYLINYGYNGNPRVYYLGPSSYRNAPEGLGENVSFYYNEIDANDYYLGIEVIGGCNDSSMTTRAALEVFGPANYDNIDSNQANYIAVNVYPYIYNGYEGNVGINTTSPTAKLDAKVDSDGERFFSMTTSAGDRLWFEQYTAGTEPDWSLRNSEAGEILKFWEHSNEAAFVGELMVGNGNTPSYKLDVNGTARFTNNVIVATPTSASHATTKNYVDTAVSPITNDEYVDESGDTMTGTLTFNSAESGAPISSTFGTAITKKNRITLSSALGSNDSGYIIHETSGESGYGNMGVLHLSPTDDNVGNDYVTIHGTNDPETIKLYTSGKIETPGTVSVATPINNEHAATKSYVDSAASSGGQWTDAGLYIYANNASDVVVTDGGRVGIGITSPTHNLDINSTAGGIDVLGSDAASILSTRNASATGSPDQFFLTHNGASVYLGNSRGNLFITSGNVGIGTTSTADTLTLGGTMKSLVASGAGGGNNILEWNNSGGLRRLTDQGGALLYGDSSMVISAGDTSQTYATNAGISGAYTGENVHLVADSAVNIVTDMQSGYAARKVSSFNTNGTLTLASTPISNSHAATKSYVDSATVLPDTAKYYLKNDDYDSFINIDDNMTTEEIKEAIGMDDSTGITKVDDPTAPAPGAFEVSGYHAVGPDSSTPYWKVDQDSEYIFETWIKVVSSTADPQRFYAGWTMYDQNKTSFGNTQRYWGSAGTQYDSNSYNDGEWHHVVGRISGVGGAYGNFIDGTEYVRLVLLLNYSSGDTVTRYAGMKLYKSAKTFTSIYATSGQRTVDNSNLVMDYDGNLFPYNIRASGNVGIGSTNPQAKLDVNGTIRVGSYGGNDQAVPKSYIDTNFAPLSGGTGSAFVQGGNSFGTTAILGTNDATDLAIETGGTTRMTVDSSGDVGIGTNNPVSKLHVYGNGEEIVFSDNATPSTYGEGVVIDIDTIESAANPIGLWLEGQDTTELGLRFRVNGSNYYQNTYNGSQLMWKHYEGGSYVPKMVLTNVGDLGVGTDNPQAKLDVSGNIKVGSYAASTDAVPKSYVDGLASKWTETGDDIYNNNSGNVGIGVSNPSAKLDVSGNINITNAESNFSLYRYKYFGGIQDGGNTSGGGSYYTYMGNGARHDAGYDWKNFYVQNHYVDPTALVLGQYGEMYLLGKSVTANGYSTLDPKLTVNSSGYTGIGTFSPGAGLDVQVGGTYSILAGSKRIGNVAEPVNSDDAATRNYVDSIFDDTGGFTVTGDLNMQDFDILGVNKLTVNTIDPLYEINDVLYSSYAASVVGGVKEEYIGKTNINSYNSSKGEYEKVIDFKDQKEGTELWLWHKTVDFSEDNVDVFVTPSGNMANVYYKVVDDSIVLRSDKRVAVSYRLIGRRFDWKSWPTIAEDQSQSAGLKIY